MKFSIGFVIISDEVCKEVSCPKKKVCVLNIQGLPVCKCPTEELCRKYASMGGGAKKMKVCGSDGVTYPSRFVTDLISEGGWSIPPSLIHVITRMEH